VVVARRKEAISKPRWRTRQPAEFGHLFAERYLVLTGAVRTVYPAQSLVRDGFEVQVVADAGASPTKMVDDIALRCMEKNGVRGLE
jgi:hypothetical protein